MDKRLEWTLNKVRYFQQPKSTWNGAQHHYSSGKCQLKLHGRLALVHILKLQHTEKINVASARETSWHVHVFWNSPRPSHPLLQGNNGQHTACGTQYWNRDFHNTKKKITRRLHFSPSRITKIRRLTILIDDESMDQLEPWFIADLGSGVSFL